MRFALFLVDHSVPFNARPLLAAVAAAPAWLSGGGAAFAIDEIVSELPAAPVAELPVEGLVAQPDDTLLVGFALLIVALGGLLNLSLGDVAADEAMLPSSVNLINQNRARKSTFIKGDSKPRGP